MQDGVNPFAYAYSLVLLSSVLEDTFSFIHMTPPDSCSLLPILNWNIILMILVDGPELSEELVEIEWVLFKLKDSAEVMQYLGYNVSDKELDSARSHLLSTYSHGHWNGLSRTSNKGPPACTEIHWCSWCYMPSAALKRCIATQTVREATGLYTNLHAIFPLRHPPPLDIWPHAHT
ncbi:hypothetical protein C8Q74DRAFT_1221651 [Fomes fomentarius]|nr:hypothetical protein C8Q74DRAFT_1221651 [Fomes fomentarius]